MTKESDLGGVGFSTQQAYEVTRREVATNNVTTPTLSQIETSFGTAASRGAGWIGVINDNGAGLALHVCVSDGTNWFYANSTKAS